MNESRVLRRHRLSHLSALEVGAGILRSRYRQGCAMVRCSGHCCRSGVLADCEERDRILLHAGLIHRCMDERQERDPAKWFGPETDDPDFSSGRAAGTQVLDGRCVFLDSGSRCVLQKAEERGGSTVGPLKPFFCRAFPVYIEAGVLTVDEEHCPGKSECCSPDEEGDLTIFDICAVELEFVLGAEGYSELKELQASL